MVASLLECAFIVSPLFAGEERFSLQMQPLLAVANNEERVREKEEELENARERGERAAADLVRATDELQQAKELERELRKELVCLLNESASAKTTTCRRKRRTSTPLRRRRVCCWRSMRRSCGSNLRRCSKTTPRRINAMSWHNRSSTAK